MIRKSGLRASLRAFPRRNVLVLLLVTGDYHLRGAEDDPHDNRKSQPVPEVAEEKFKILHSLLVNDFSVNKSLHHFTAEVRLGREPLVELPPSFLVVLVIRVNLISDGKEQPDVCYGDPSEAAGLEPSDEGRAERLVGIEAMLPFP